METVVRNMHGRDPVCLYVETDSNISSIGGRKNRPVTLRTVDLTADPCNFLRVQSETDQRMRAWLERQVP